MKVVVLDDQSYKWQSFFSIFNPTAHGVTWHTPYLGKTGREHLLTIGYHMQHWCIFAYLKSDDRNKFIPPTSAGTMFANFGIIARWLIANQ